MRVTPKLALALLASTALVSCGPMSAFAGDSYSSGVFPGSTIHVANQSALALANPNNAVFIHRDGYLSAGDGGDVNYLYSPAPCTVNVGLGDGGSQVPAANGNCWVEQPPSPGVSVKTFGAKCDAQIIYSFLEVTAGSGGTRVITITSNLASTEVGKKINVGIGGATATSAWQGVIAAVAPNTITVTAAPGTAITTFTNASIQWGTDDTAPITAAVAAWQGISPIILPGQCGVSSTITLNAAGAQMYGTLSPPGHHDGIVPFTPPLSSALVWLGGFAPVFNQTSITGVNNYAVKFQHVHDLAFFAGNSASVGRNIATVAESHAENLYAADAPSTGFNFLYGVNGATALHEIAATCNNTESGFVAEGWLYGAESNYYLGGNLTFQANGATSPVNTCGSVFSGFHSFFSTGEAISVPMADHNTFLNFMAVGAGSATTAYSVHLSSINSSYYAQGNKFIGLSVGNIATNTQGLIKVETGALGNMFIGVDTFDPPVGWTPIIPAGTGTTCITDQGTSCAPDTTTKPYVLSYSTLAALTCNAAATGVEYAITNSNVSTFGTAITAAGSYAGKAFCDGTSWKFR